MSLQLERKAGLQLLCPASSRIRREERIVFIVALESFLYKKLLGRAMSANSVSSVTLQTGRNRDVKPGESSEKPWQRELGISGDGGKCPQVKEFKNSPPSSVAAVPAAGPAQARAMLPFPLCWVLNH